MFTQLGQFRWSAFSARRAARVTLGVTLPLIAGWASGHLGYGVYMALGSLPAGFASFQGETRSRIAAVALASIGMAVSTFLGAATAETESWWLTAIVTLWAYITGLSVCLGQLASVAVLQWSSALLVASGLPLGPQEAALRAAFVFAGGILQAAIIVVSWTLQPGARERDALAASYRAMAAYALQLASGKPQAPPTAAFPAEEALRDPNPFLRTETRLAYYMLLEQAERVRASLAAVGAYVAGPYAGEVRALISGTAAVLERAAEALAAGPDRRFSIAREINSRVERLKIDLAPAWRWSAEPLLGQLRAVARMLVWIDTGEAAELEARAEPVSNRSGILRTLTVAGAQLWANVTTTSEAGRHALRLAVVALLAELLVRVTGLYQGRWVALTIFFVLKPDYTSTRYRGLQRALGTILGAGVGAAVASFSHLDQGMLIVSAAVCVAAAYALFSVSYLLFSVPLTAFIVLLLALLGMPVAANAEARIIDTCIGAALALIAYIVWPTWQGTTGQQIFAALLDTHRDYTTALLRELSHRDVGASRLRALQAAARRARSDAEAAAARLAEEPERPPLTPDLAQLLFATITRIAHAELALHALVLARSEDATRCSADSLMDRLSSAIEIAMTDMADALRNLERPGAIPDLRPIYAGFIDAPDGHTDPLAGIVDRLVDAIDTLRDILEKHL